MSAGAGGLFGRIAIEKGFCTEAQLARALRFQEEVRSLGLSKPLGEILVADGVLTADQVQLVIRLQKVNEQRQRNKHFAKVALRNGLVTQEQIDMALETVKEEGFRRPVGEILVERLALTPTAERAIRVALDRARAQSQPRAPGASEPAEPPPAAGPATAKLGVALELDPAESLAALAIERRVRDVLFAAVALRDGLVLVPELERALRDQLGRTDEDPLLESVLKERGILSKDEVGTIAASLDRSREDKVTIPGYTWTGVLGRGATSIVLRARHELIGREVAIKLFRTEHVAAMDADALIEEARTVAKIRHPNVVGLYDVGRVHRRVYYVMELVDGPTLDEELRKRGGPLPEGEALARTREIARALEAIHERGLVHRDVKPQNVLIASNGPAQEVTAKLTDLGLAREVGEGSIEERSAIFGSPFYMAPEQAQGDAVDIRADLYGLGATLYHALTGSPPYEGTEAVGIMMRHLTDPVPDPRTRRADVSDGAAALVAALMAKAPADRPATPSEVVARIDALLAPAEQAASESGRPAAAP